MAGGNSKLPRVNATIDAGLMRRRLTISQSQQTNDGAGGYTTAWVAVATVFGALIPWKTYESLLAMQVRDKTMTRYFVRWMPSTVITPGMRLTDNDSPGGQGKTYTIVEAIDMDGTQRQLRLTCASVAP